MSGFSDDVGKSMDELSEIISTGNEIAVKVLEQLNATQSYIATNDKKMIDRFYEVSSVIHQNIEKYLSLHLSDEENGQVQKIKLIHSRIEVLAEQVFALYELGNKKEIQITLQDLITNQEQMRKEIGALVSLARGRFEKLNSDFQTNLNRIMLVLSSVGIGAIVLGLLVSFSVIKSITNSLKKLKDVIFTFSSGDLTIRTEVTTKDEIGELIENFNQFSDKLNEMVKQVVRSAEQVNVTVSQISSSSEQMAIGAESQTAQIAQITSAVKELTTTAMIVAKNAGEVAENSRKAMSIAQNSGEVIRQAINGLMHISQMVNESANMVMELVKKAEEINKIVDVIEDIADRTNLLSLNAAIEAAVAGDEGKGFAVVSDEIRKLAEQTQEATGEIFKVIKTTQGDINDLMDVMGTGVEKAESNINLANKTGEALEDIINSSQRITDMIQQIALSADQQSTTSEQILENVEVVSTVVKETEKGAQNLAKASQNLIDQSQRLKKSISIFKLA
jgi:methyl-accepting chemotaxis protein